MNAATANSGEKTKRQSGRGLLSAVNAAGGLAVLPAVKDAALRQRRCNIRGAARIPCCSFVANRPPLSSNSAQWHLEHSMASLVSRRSRLVESSVTARAKRKVWQPKSSTGLAEGDADEALGQSSLFRLGLFLAPAFLGLAYVLAVLPEIAENPGMAVTGPWKFGLIATHVFVFVLIPVAARIFYEALPRLGVKRTGVFASQLGFAFVMIGIACEIGWHVTQSWYYVNDFTMLNFMFYFFEITGFSLSADGFRKEDSWTARALDLTFAFCLFGTSILYPQGAQVGNDSYKIPIYITLALITGVLTYRGYKALEDWRVVFYPTLSVGVNLFFVYLLNTYGREESLNALFHILHDLFGTEAGVAVLVWLVYQKIPASQAKT